jgi:hypothetical protein
MREVILNDGRSWNPPHWRILAHPSMKFLAAALASGVVGFVVGYRILTPDVGTSDQMAEIVDRFGLPNMLRTFPHTRAIRWKKERAWDCWTIMGWAHPSKFDTWIAQGLRLNGRLTKFPIDGGRVDAYLAREYGLTEGLSCTSTQIIGDKFQTKIYVPTDGRFVITVFRSRR